MQKFVRETSLLPFLEMKQGILDRVAEWREGPPADDVSLVLVEVALNVFRPRLFNHEAKQLLFPYANYVYRRSLQVYLSADIS